MSRECTITPTLEEVNVITQETLEALLNKWHSMYVINDEIKNQRFDQFLTHLKVFYRDMLLSEESRKNCYMKEVEKKLKECKALEKALNVSINCDIQCSDTPLTEVIKRLDNSLKSFEELKLERIAKFENLRTKENSLCKLLAFKEVHISNAIPSEDDIERLEHHLFVLEEEKLKRTEVFLSSREHILEFINRLEVSVSTLFEFEKTLVDSNEVYSLTLEDLNRLKETEITYQHQFEAAKLKVQYMYNELEKLWDRLEIDEHYKIEFTNTHSGVGKKTIENIQKEIHRCEKLRKDLIEPLLRKTKCQIVDMCNRLCFSDEQRSQYTSYDKSHCSEDLLDILEIELGKLQYIFNENSEILELARKHRDMWERMLELEEIGKDKSRLFNNRGGQLLREEKERKTIDQALPKLYKKLEDLLVDYESREGTPFLYYGSNLLQRIREDIEQRTINKQNKVTKKCEGKHVTDSAVKRKLNVMVTPKSEQRKRLKLASSTSSLASSASKPSNKSVDGRCGSRSRIALFKDKDTSVASSYSLFQEEIEEKKRSTNMTLNPGRQPLKEINSPVLIFHSSPSQEMKTPRFNFRPRPTEFKSSNNAVAASTGKKHATKSVAMTPASTRKMGTPKTITKSTSRVATPKHYAMTSSTIRTITPSRINTPKSRHFFDTPTSTTRPTTHNTLSISKPSKFNFNF